MSTKSGLDHGLDHWIGSSDRKNNNNNSNKNNNKIKKKSSNEDVTQADRKSTRFTRI